MQRSRRQMQVQARVDDEIWALEMVGKERNGSGWSFKYSIYLWLVDPLRGGAAPTGRSASSGGGYSAWLIHESRHDLLPR